MRSENPFSINNMGIGGTPFPTFYNSPEEEQSFSQRDLDNNLTSCMITGNNEVGKGENGCPLFGKVVWVSQECYPETEIPNLVAVQARGVARFKIGEEGVTLNDPVQLARGGKVMAAPRDQTDYGVVISIDSEENWCDVWLS